MKKLLCAVLTALLVAGSAFGQQTESPKNPTKNKPPATPQSQEKPAETTPKPEATPEQKPAIRETSGDKDKDKDKEEHFDVAEVPPVVTHHQITVDGKTLSRVLRVERGR